MSGRKNVRLVVGFLDLTLYAKTSETLADERLAAIIDEHYERVAAAIEAAGGQVVKFIGDATLLVVEPESADRAVIGLLELKPAIDDWLASLGWESKLIVKLHVGDLVAGPFGPREAKRFDVIGRTVNDTARLPSRGFAISEQVFEMLSPALRQRFEKHAKSPTYVPVGEARV